MHILVNVARLSLKVLAHGGAIYLLAFPAIPSRYTCTFTRFFFSRYRHPIYKTNQSIGKKRHLRRHFPPFPTPETRAPARPSTSHSGEWSWNLTGSSFRPPSCANFNPAHFFHQGTNDHRCRVFCNTPRLCESSMVFPQVYCQL